MLTIKSVYVGNENEAYIEKRFRDGLNVVFSDDNHMGKTVVMQSLMYALGGAMLGSRLHLIAMTIIILLISRSVGSFCPFSGERIHSLFCKTKTSI